MIECEKKKYHIFYYIIVCIIIVFCIALFFRMKNCNDVQETELDIERLSEWTYHKSDGTTTILTLPIELNTDTPRTRIELSTQIKPQFGDYLYLRTVYTPVEVYVDDVLIYDCGKVGTFPSILKDPPFQAKLLPLWRVDEPVCLRLVYESPIDYQITYLYTIRIGDATQIQREILQEMGLSLFLMILLFCVSILLTIIALVLLYAQKKGISFLWLGLFSLCVSAWVLGEMEIFVLVVQNPSWIHIAKFLGLFIMPIPFFRFFLSLVPFSPKSKKWLLCTIFILDIFLALAIILQYMGVVTFVKILPIFHVIEPLSLCLLFYCMYRERKRVQQKFSNLFCGMVLAFLICSIFEMEHYYFVKNSVSKSVIFHLSIFVFVIFLGIMIARYMKETTILQEKNQQLVQKVSLMGAQIKAQKLQYELLSEKEAVIRRKRHDLRHQLAVIRTYATQKQNDALVSYLDELSVPLPSDFYHTFCKNSAINALCCYYYTLANKKNITDVQIQLDIDVDTGVILSSDLCVLIGNLLENAITANTTIDTYIPYIHLRSRIQNDILTIVMDNTYTMVQQNESGEFVSTKSESGGVGLQSIQNIAKKYKGNSYFSAEDCVFHSSVYLHLK